MLREEAERIHEKILKSNLIKTLTESEMESLVDVIYREPCNDDKSITINFVGKEEAEEFRRYMEQQAIKGVLGEVEPCEDCVSRELVRKEFCNWVMCKKIPNDFLYKLGGLPSVQPTRKRGKWTRELIRNDNGGCIGAKMICSECGKDNEHDEYMDFCPNCASDNREVVSK